MGRPPIGKQAMSGAERQRRYLERLIKSDKRAIKPDDYALAQQQLSATRLELAQAQSRIAALESALKQAQAASSVKTSSAHPSQPEPSEEVALLEIKIAVLKTANKELRSKLATLKRWYETEMFRSGKMPLATLRAIAKCLHPDYTPSAAERESACRLFNVFTDSARGK